VKLQETACVESEIFFEKSLGIEDGASFEGQIRRTSEPASVVAVSKDSPVTGTSETTEPTGLAAALSCDPAEIDRKIVSKSQPRREREVSRMARIARDSTTDDPKDGSLTPEESSGAVQQN
jgi:hypothetical protein